MNHEARQTPEAIGPTASSWQGRIGLAIPTLNAGEHLDRLLPALQSQTLVPARFLVIDSSSQDDTVLRCRAAGAEVRTIARESFDHGATRQMAVELLDDVDFVIFLTQDAIPAHPDAFWNLIEAFRGPNVGMAYGRQLPAPNAGPIGAHARLYNYPDRSHVRTMADAARLGIKTVFCSNSFAAYRRSALMETGGFLRGIIFGEDTLMAASLLRKGKSVCYAAEAMVHHSHDYGLVDEFRRYFDIGVLHGSQTELLHDFDRTDGEGFRFVGSELNYLRARAAHVIPVALLRTSLKYSGYRLGRAARYLPIAVNRQLSLNRSYWANPTNRFERAGPAPAAGAEERIEPYRTPCSGLRLTGSPIAGTERGRPRLGSDVGQ